MTHTATYSTYLGASYIHLRPVCRLRSPALAVADVTFSKLQSTCFFKSKFTFSRVPVERGDQPRHHAPRVTTLERHQRVPRRSIVSLSYASTGSAPNAFLAITHMPDSSAIVCASNPRFLATMLPMTASDRQTRPSGYISLMLATMTENGRSRCRPSRPSLYTWLL